MVKLETTLVGLVATTVLLTSIAAGINVAAYQIGKVIGHHQERKDKSKVKRNNYDNFRKENEES